MKERIDFLRNELHKHNYQYYVLNHPTVSDFEFDKLMKELQLLEEQNPQYFDINSPTQKVGSDINIQFKQIKHKYPMLSLTNTYNSDDIEEFYNRVNKLLNGEEFEIVCELKYDGTSISLIYEDGKLKNAITRGNGVEGDDVTNNVRVIKSIPLQLQGDYPPYLEMRGEIVLPFKAFEAINKKKKEEGEEEYASPRNLASGTLKSLNSAIVAERNLDAYLYYMLGDSLPCSTHSENLQKAREWGFKISNDMKVCKTLNDVYEFINQMGIKRNDLPVAIDGVVLKVNSLKQQMNLGLNSKSPRWATSYKFQAEQAETKLLSVTYQTGRTGIVTPVANLDTVLLAGSQISRATLHNADFMNDLDLHEGDYVIIERGGEVIPKVVGVSQNIVRDINAKKIEFTKVCPDCGTLLSKEDDKVAYFCTNNSCPSQMKARLIHFCSKKAMNINIGDKNVETLFNNGFVIHPSDFYILHEKSELLKELEGWGERSVEILLNSIEKSKQVPFERVLFSLGIKGVGETTAKKLAKKFKNIYKIVNVSEEEISSIEDIGKEVSTSISQHFINSNNLEEINLLKNYLNFEGEYNDVNLSNKLEGQTIVITGSFDKHSRDEYKIMIEQHGGKNSGSISKKTNYVLIGENAGSTKLEKIEKLNIPTLNEDEFLNLIN